MSDRATRLPFRAASALSAGVALIAVFLYPRGAAADPVWVDIRGGYPLVLGGQWGDSTYAGKFTLGARFGASLSDREGEPRAVLMFGFDHYSLTNSVPDASGPGDGSIRASVTTFPIYLFYCPGWRGRGRAIDLLLGGSMGVASRQFENIDGATFAGTFSLSAMAPLYPTSESRFFLAPEIELTHITEGAGSEVGSVTVVAFGLRLGLGSSYAERTDEPEWVPPPPPPAPPPDPPPPPPPAEPVAPPPASYPPAPAEPATPPPPSYPEPAGPT